jgi:hypothetical protein
MAVIYGLLKEDSKGYFLLLMTVAMVGVVEEALAVLLVLAAPLRRGRPVVQVLQLLAAVVVVAFSGVLEDLAVL